MYLGHVKVDTLIVKDSNVCPLACIVLFRFHFLSLHLSISPHSPGGFDCSLAPCEEEQMQIETPSHKHMQTDISSRAHN